MQGERTPVQWFAFIVAEPRSTSEEVVCFGNQCMHARNSACARGILEIPGHEPIGLLPMVLGTIMCIVSPDHVRNM